MIKKLICFFRGHDIELDYPLIDCIRVRYLPLRGKCNKCNERYFYHGFWQKE